MVNINRNTAGKLGITIIDMAVHLTFLMFKYNLLSVIFIHEILTLTLFMSRVLFIEFIYFVLP